MNTFMSLYADYNWYVAIRLMVCYFFVDWLYAKYTLHVVALKPASAASIGALMHFLLAFGVVSYTQNWLYVLPLVVGSRVGTYVVVHWEKHKKGKS